MAVVCFAHPGVWMFGPTSLTRGEGLIAGPLHVVGRELGGEGCGGGGGGMREDAPKSTVICLMAILNSTP